MVSLLYHSCGTPSGTRFDTRDITSTNDSGSVPKAHPHNKKNARHRRLLRYVRTGPTANTHAPTHAPPHPSCFGKGGEIERRHVHHADTTHGHRARRTGIGGFSAGAIEAGHEVVLGIDNNSEALACFAASVPEARKLCEALPSHVVDWPNEPDTHAHFSPPCTALSRARAGSATAEQLDGGIEHLRWSVRTALAHFTSFSVETVSVPQTRALMEEETRAHPKRLSYAVVESADYGVPQTRRRLIAGPPELVARLKAAPVARRVSVADAFGGSPPSPYLKNTTSRGSGDGAR